MKTTIKISMIAVLATGLIQAESSMKKYAVKSAKIEYSIKSSGNVMGMETKTIGKKRLIFDDYGVRELEENSQVNQTKGLGQNKVRKEHSLKYMNDLILYSVNFKKKKILRVENRGASMAVMFAGEKNLEEGGEAMLKKMGGKKIGTDKVAGYNCDIWKMTASKLCIYKGVSLRTETDVMGIKSVEIATKAEFGLSLSQDDFKLPDFPIYDNHGNKLDIDRSKLDEMDKKDSATLSKKNNEDQNDMAEAGKAIAVGIAAAKEAGYDLKSGKDMTPAQEKAMKKAMIDAMGGEKSMVEKAKQEILQEGKMIPQAKKCFKHANSVKEANICEEQIDSDDPELHYKWNDKIKSDLLKELDEFEKAIPCIKKAETVKELEICLPDED